MTTVVTKPTLKVRRGPRESTLVLLPSADTSLRTLERALVRNGVTGVVLRAERQVFVPLSQFARAHPKLGDWELDLDPQVRTMILTMADHFQAHWRAREVVARVGEPEVALAMLEDFPERDLLDAHQLQAVAAATHPDVRGLCLFDEQGLGKTVTTVFSYHRLRKMGLITKMLVISPKNMVYEWLRDLERFLGARYRGLAVVGTEREKRSSLNQKADVYVTNFETPVGLHDRLRELLEVEQGRALLVVDESFFVKNSVTRRARAIRSLRRSVRRCLVLCGTPAPNSAHDIVEQFNIADGGVTFDGVAVPKDREAARPIVQQTIQERGIYLRRLKQDVLPDLPGKTFNRVLVPMQPKQERAYSAALRSYVEDLRATDDISFKKEITSFLARRMALLQICSHPRGVLAGYDEVPAKLVALDLVLEELVSRRKEKVIVWSYFTLSLDAIMARYDRFNPVRCDGRVSSAAERRKAVRKFQEDDRTMLFVGNPAAAGAGLTLHRARFAVYESMSNQAAHYLQSLDRIHRRGQRRAVEYLVLLCDRTIELKEYDRLLRKQDSAHALLGDNIDPPTSRSAMVNEAVDAARLLGISDVEGIAP